MSGLVQAVSRLSRCSDTQVLVAESVNTQVLVAESVKIDIVFRKIISSLAMQCGCISSLDFRLHASSFFDFYKSKLDRLNCILLQKPPYSGYIRNPY